MSFLRIITASILFAALALSAFAQQTQIPIEIKTTPSKQRARRPLDELQIMSERARAAEVRGDLERALPIYQEMLARDPWNGQALQGINRSLLILKEYDQAEKFLNEWIAKNDFRPQPVPPGDLTSKYSLTLQLGQVELARENKDRAWEIWNRALSEAGRTPETVNALVNVLQQNRLWEDSERLIREFRKSGNQPAFMSLELASSLQGQMNFAAATEELLLYSESSPSGWQLAASYMRRYPEDPVVIEKVSAVLQRAVQRDRKNAQLWKLLAGWSHKVADLETYLNATIAGDSLGNGGGLDVLRASQQLLREDEIELARRGFRKTLAFKPADDVAAEAEIGLGQCLEALGEWNEAKQAYLDFVDRHPNFQQVDQAKFRTADILLRHEDNPAAALTILRGLWARPQGVSKTEVGRAIGDCHAWMGEYDAAIEAWNNVVNLDRGLGEEGTLAMLRVARANLWRDSTDAALDALDKITEANPLNTAFNDAVLYSALLGEGGVYRAQRAFAEADYASFRNEDSLAAVRFAESADLLKAGKMAEWARYSQAIALRESQQPQAAVAALDSFIVNYRESVDLDRAKYMRAVILMDDLHEDKLALAELQQFLIDHPRSIYLEPARRRARILQARVS